MLPARPIIRAFTERSELHERGARGGGESKHTYQGKKSRRTGGCTQRSIRTRDAHRGWKLKVKRLGTRRTSEVSSRYHTRWRKVDMDSKPSRRLGGVKRAGTTHQQWRCVRGVSKSKFILVYFVYTVHIIYGVLRIHVRTGGKCSNLLRR